MKKYLIILIIQLFVLTFEQINIQAQTFEMSLNGFTNELYYNIYGLSNDGSLIAFSNESQIYLYSAINDKIVNMATYPEVENNSYSYRIYFSKDNSKLLNMQLRIIELESNSIIDSIENPRSGALIHVDDNWDNFCFKNIDSLYIYNNITKKITFEFDINDEIVDFKFDNKNNGIYIVKDSFDNYSIHIINLSNYETNKIMDINGFRNDLKMNINSKYLMVYGESMNYKIHQIQIFDLESMETVNLVHDAFLLGTEINFDKNNDSYIYRDTSYNLIRLKFTQNVREILVPKLNYWSELIFSDIKGDIYLNKSTIFHCLRYAISDNKFYPILTGRSCITNFGYFEKDDILIQDVENVVNIFSLKNHTYELFDNKTVVQNTFEPHKKIFKQVNDISFAQSFYLSSYNLFYIELISTRDKKLSLKKLIEIQGEEIYDFHISKDEKFLFYITDKGILTKYNIENKSVVYKTDYNPDRIDHIVFSPDENIGLLYISQGINQIPLLFNPIDGEKIFWYDFKDRDGHYLNHYNVTSQVDFSINIIYEIMSSNKGQGSISIWSLVIDSIAQIPIPIPFNIARFSDDFKFLFTATDTVITIFSFPDLVQIESFINSRAFPVYIQGSNDYNQILNLFITSDNKYLIANNCSSQANIYNLEKDNVLSVDTELKDNESELYIFPNPTQDLVSILYDDNNMNFSKYEIVNYLGTTMLSGTSYSSLQIDVKSLLPGFYYVKLSGSFNQILTKQFIKY